MATTTDRKEELNGEQDSEMRPLVEGDQGKLEEQGSSLPQASFNYINSIIGSGVIGMAFALERAGLVVGLLLLVFLAFLTDFSLILLVNAAEKAGVQSYAMLGRRSFGQPGHALLILLQFLYPFVAMLSYNIIVGDTVTRVVAAYLPASHALSLENLRRSVVGVATIFLTLPLSLFKDLTRLTCASLFSLFLTAFILLTIWIRMPTLSHLWSFKEEPLVYTNWGVPEAIGVMSFAFMCHHSTFLLWGSLKAPSSHRWARLTHVSVLSSAVVQALFALGGYLTFRSQVQGDLLNNYCQGDHLLNAARLAFSLTVLLTYPIECLVARNVLLHLFCEPEVPPRSWVAPTLTFVLVITAAIVSFFLECLGTALHLNGILAAIPLAYIIPAACYLRQEWETAFNMVKLGAWGLVSLGLIFSLVGVVNLVLQGTPSCLQGAEMPYCSAARHPVALP